MTESLTSRPLRLLVSLGTAGAATTQTDLPPKIFALPDNNPLMTPGTELAGTFYSAAGTPAELPGVGRYLLWVVDEAFALETRIEVPYAEFDHPASNTRFLLETLPPLLERYGVQGVAFAMNLSLIHI